MQRGLKKKQDQRGQKRSDHSFSPGPEGDVNGLVSRLLLASIPSSAGIFSLRTSPPALGRILSTYPATVHIFFSIFPPAHPFHQNGPLRTCFGFIPLSLWELYSRILITMVKIGGWITTKKIGCYNSLLWRVGGVLMALAGAFMIDTHCMQGKSKLQARQPEKQAEVRKTTQESHEDPVTPSDNSS